MEKHVIGEALCALHAIAKPRHFDIYLRCRWEGNVFYLEAIRNYPESSASLLLTGTSIRPLIDQMQTLLLNFPDLGAVKEHPDA